MSTIPTPNLPEAYNFCDPTKITAREIMSLRGRVGLAVEDETVWRQCVDRSLVTVGVRNEAGLLVGIGFLTGSARHAVLCDFVVDPDFQDQGIGTAILYKRLETANELKIRYIYAELSKANLLRPKYIKFGFKATRGGLFYTNT